MDEALGRKALALLDEIAAKQKGSRTSACKASGVGPLAQSQLAKGEGCTKQTYARIAEAYARVMGAPAPAPSKGEDGDESDESEASEDGDEDESDEESEADEEDEDEESEGDEGDEGDEDDDDSEDDEPEPPASRVKKAKVAAHHLEKIVTVRGTTQTLTAWAAQVGVTKGALWIHAKKNGLTIEEEIEQRLGAKRPPRAPAKAKPPLARRPKAEASTRPAPPKRSPVPASQESELIRAARLIERLGGIDRAERIAEVLS